MVQRNFIVSAIALLGLSQVVVDAAPSINNANQLFGRIYKSHHLYARDNNTMTNNTMSNNTTDSSNSTTAIEDALCPINLTNNSLDALNHFQGIFFGDYFVSNQNVEGPLAIGGALNGANFTINSAANATTVCQDNGNAINVFEQYGLVLAGQSQSNNVTVNGNAYLASGVNVGLVAPSCTVEFNNGTGALDFEALKNASYEASEYLASQTPNMLLSQNGKVQKVNGTVEDQFYSFKFNTCKTPAACGVEESQASNPQGILFYNGTKWKGAKFPKDKPVVLNIPVTTGTTLVINGDNPSKKLPTCNAVFHIYPVDSEGKFLANGSITINQESKKYITGLFFAPRATITTGATGGFEGQVIASGFNGGSASGPIIKSFDEDSCMFERTCFPFNLDADKKDDSHSEEPATTTVLTATTTVLTAATTVPTATTTVPTGITTIYLHESVPTRLAKRDDTEATGVATAAPIVTAAPISESDSASADEFTAVSSASTSASSDIATTAPSATTIMYTDLPTTATTIIYTDLPATATTIIYTDVSTTATPSSATTVMSTTDVSTEPQTATLTPTSTSNIESTTTLVPPPHTETITPNPIPTSSLRMTESTVTYTSIKTKLFTFVVTVPQAQATY